MSPVLIWAAGAGAGFLAVLARVGWRRELKGFAFALLMTTGAVYWTFAEYAVYRWLYAWMPRGGMLGGLIRRRSLARVSPR